MTIWHVVLVMMFAGQHVEFVGTTGFPSRAACNEHAMKLTALPIASPFALTCVGEVRA